MRARILAVGAHFLFSAFLVCCAMGVVYLIWYPFPLARATGVSTIFFLLVAVDVVIGPMLMFVIYKPKRKNLKFDIACVIVLQVGAFSYGLHAISSARPAWIVFNVDRFDAGQANELDDRYLKNARPEFQSAPWGRPRWVASIVPTDREMRNQLILESSAGGADLVQRLDLYIPVEQATPEIKMKSHSLDELVRFNDEKECLSILKKWPEADAWLPLVAKKEAMVVLIKKKTGMPLGIVDLRPWGSDRN